MIQIFSFNFYPNNKKRFDERCGGGANPGFAIFIHHRRCYGAATTIVKPGQTRRQV